MADFSTSITTPEILRPIIESEIERLIAILDGMEPDPDLEETADDEPWLGWNGQGGFAGWDEDREVDTSDDEPSLGAVEVKLPFPLDRLGGGHGHCLFPSLYREPCELNRLQPTPMGRRWQR